MSRSSGSLNPIFAFSVENPAEGNTVYLDSLKLAFLAVNLQIELEPGALENLLERIEIVNFNEYKARALNKPAAILAQIEVNEDITNPLFLNLKENISDQNDSDYSITAQTADTFVVYVNFNSSATNRNFRLKLADIRAYDVNKLAPVEVIDELGRPLSESERNTSGALTVIPDDIKQAFRNYPNPFGRDYDETTIVFWLDQDSDVEIRIFTLTGGLVKTYMLPNQPRGLNDRDVKWDGHNDRGKRVLNGVYICQIQIKPHGGGGNKTFITKIAYIK